jgi:hypothetical protein
MINIEEVFNKFEDEFLKFDRVLDKLHPRKDVSAFILLDILVPNGNTDIISVLGYDRIYLDTDCDKLSEEATEQDILMLIRCGVMYDSKYNCLSMFV